MGTGFHSEPCDDGRRFHTGAPDHGARRDPPSVRNDAVLVDPLDPRVEKDLYAHLRKRAVRVHAKLFGERAQDFGAGLDQKDACRRGVNAAEVSNEGRVGEFCNRARHLDTRGTGADNDERHERSAPFVVRAHLRLFEGEKQATADLYGIREGLRRWSEGRPFIVTEIVVL